MEILESLQQWLHQSPAILPSLFFLLLLSIVLVYLNYKEHSKKEEEVGGKSRLPPSPPKLPVIGNLHQLGARPHRSLHSLSRTHGPLMLVHLGSAPYVIASTASAAKEILKTHDLAFASRFKSAVGDKCSYGYKDVALAPYGEHWRQAKKVIVLHLLSASRVRSYRPAREAEVSAMLNRIRDGGEGVVNVSEALGDVVFDISRRVFLGNKYSEADLPGGEKGVRALINELMEVLGNLDVGQFVPWLAWVNRLNGFYSRVDKVARNLDAIMDRVIEDHIARRRRGGGDKEENSQGRSFVDVMLDLAEEESSSTNNGFSLDRDSMKAILQDMFTGGNHTVFTVLDWSMTELMRHPHAMHKLRAEVRRICGSGRRMVTEDDTERMTYMKCVLKEVLRLHPTLPFLVPHEAVEAVELQQGTYRLPKGTRVMVNAWAVARDPEFWETPDEFSPERFLDSPVDFRGTDFQFIPFGAGRRGCPGTSFAIATAELVLANLIYCFDWDLPDGLTAADLDLSEASGLVNSRKLSLLLRAKPHVV